MRLAYAPDGGSRSQLAPKSAALSGAPGAASLPVRRPPTRERAVSDPELTFMIGPMNGRKAPETGLRVEVFHGRRLDQC